MDNRKYFKYKAEELESEFKGAGGDFAVLEDLEEELSHRSMKRARKLLENIQQSMNSHAPTPVVSDSLAVKVKPAANQSYQIMDDSIINWGKALSNDASKPVYADEMLEVKTLHNRPLDILDTWTVLEALLSGGQLYLH